MDEGTRWVHQGTRESSGALGPRRGGAWENDHRGAVRAKDFVAGYMIVEARDLAHAVELSSECPIFETGGVVEVRPVAKM
ncbi:MAG: YciI family protein [Phycisphaerales bacterium]